MADLAQVIGAVATGALLTVAAMLVFRLHSERRAERERRVEAAAAATVIGVEALRQQARANPGETIPRALEGAMEVRSKAHLRMLVSKKTAPPKAPVRTRPEPDGTTRRRPARESRR